MKRKRKVIIGSIVTSILFVVMVSAGVYHHSKNNNLEEETTVIEDDTQKKEITKANFKGLDTNINGNVQDGTLDLTNSEEIKAMLQANVDKSAMTYRININPIFESGQAEGELMIENVADNQYLLQVEIIEEASSKQIYISPVLKPDQSIEKGTLTYDLPEGKHKAIAYFRCYEKETQVIVGEVGMKINITVLS